MCIRDRIVHTADWQLGKPFGRFPDDVRTALMEARLDVIDTIGRVAEEHRATHVVVAGDVFDTPAIRRRLRMFRLFYLLTAIGMWPRAIRNWWRRRRQPREGFKGDTLQPGNP